MHMGNCFQVTFKRNLRQRIITCQQQNLKIRKLQVLCRKQNLTKNCLAMQRLETNLLNTQKILHMSKKLLAK